MNRSLQVSLGALFVLASIVGLVVNTRRFERDDHSSNVTVRADGWRLEHTGASASRALELGRYVLPSPGLLHVVVCAHPDADPHASLRVAGPGIAHPETEALTADEARGNRCYDAEFRGREAGRFTATLVVAGERVPTSVGIVEVHASRRITPKAMWPVVALVLGFVLIVTASRRPLPAISEPVAVIAEDPSDAFPSSMMGGIVPPEYIVPGADGPDFEVLRHVTHVPEPPWWMAFAGKPAPVSWRWSWLLALGVLVLVHVVLFGVVIVYFVATGMKSGSMETASFIVLSTIFQHTLMALGAAWMLGAFIARDKLTALGLLPVNRLEVLRSIVIAMGLLAIAVVSSKLIKDVSETPMGQLLERVPVRYGLGFGALLAPFTEELFFRGVLVPTFGKRWPVVGIIASALIFTAMHAMQLSGALVGLIPIASVGFVNAYLRAKTGGITQSWIVHLVYNGALSVGLYFG